MHNLAVLGLRQDKKGLPNQDPRRQRWEEKAGRLGDLIAVPSKYVNGPEADLASVDSMEEEYKKSQAKLAYKAALKFLKEPINVLDAACGAMRFGRHLARFIRPKGGRYVGIDWSETILAYAAQKLEAEGELDDNIMLTAASLIELPRFDFRFDFIANGQNWIHVVEHALFRIAVAEQCEVLAPEGVVFGYAPFLDHNYQYHRRPRKNPDTLIRWEREVKLEYAKHNIVFRESHLSKYFDEVYTTLVLQRERPCAYRQ
jgi:SAM-dependent methyltransferase